MVNDDKNSSLVQAVIIAGMEPQQFARIERCAPDMKDYNFHWFQIT